MKAQYFFVLVALIVVIATNSCKKEVLYVEADQTPALPSDADGAFYAQRDSVKTWNSDSVSLYDYAFAWFSNSNNSNTTQVVDSISVNGIPMVDSALYGTSSFPWYVTSNTAPPNLNGTNVTWAVTGNSALSIPSFNKTDSTLYPAILWAALPQYVSAASLPTIQFTVLTTGIMQIVCYVTDQRTAQTYAVNFNGTVTSIDLQKMSAVGIQRGDELIIQLVPVEYTGQIIGSKKYYFVKETVYTQYTYAN